MADEVEAKLMITAPDAEAIYEAVSRIDAVGGYRVTRREVEEIEDVYFDSPERVLFAAGLALRVRHVNGREVLTIKGEARVEDGVTAREELEVEWSSEGFDDVLEALNQAGVVLGNAEVARERTSAREAMEALDLIANAARGNRRVALTLMLDGEVMAELDVDAATFHPAGRTVRHYEVECEAKGSGDASAVRDVLDALQARFDGLRAWPVSKLALGEALEALAAIDKLQALLEGDRLGRAGYDLIEEAAG